MPGKRTPERPSIYVKDFEGRFLETSEEFYKREAEQCLLMDDASAYLKRVSDWVLSSETILTPLFRLRIVSLKSKRAVPTISCLAQLHP